MIDRIDRFLYDNENKNDDKKCLHVNYIQYSECIMNRTLGSGDSR
jgi:hypothetical protein